MIYCVRIGEFSAWVRRRISAGVTDVAIVADGRIVSCSRTLRDAGLIGERADRGRSLFPDAAFHQHDPRLDAAIWEDLLLLLADLSPHLLPLAPGHALLAPFDEEGVALLAASLGAQLGLARTRLIAMLAALEAEPGGVCRIDEGSEAFLARVPIRHLREFNFDSEIIERLALFGLTTIARVAALSRRHLKSQFGADGVRLHDLLHPGDDPPIPLYTPPPRIVVDREFEQALVEPGELLPPLEEMLVEAARQLDRRQAWTLTIRLHGEETRLQRRLLRSATSRHAQLRVVAERLLTAMLGADRTATGMRLELGGLVEPRPIQGGLFDHRPALYEAVRALHRRFPGRLVRAILHCPDAYLPEEAFQFEPYPTEPPPRAKRRKRR